MKRTLCLTCVVGLMLVGVANGDEPTRWLNVDVTEQSSNTNVKVHLPLDLVLTVIDGVKVDHFDAGKVDLELGDADVEWAKILSAIKDAPDGKFVTVASDDADVEVKKQSGLMTVHVTEKVHDNAVVDVKLPMNLIDAVSIDEDNRIDVKAILSSLASLPDGELVKVTSDEANVRVWVE